MDELTRCEFFIVLAIFILFRILTESGETESFCQSCSDNKTNNANTGISTNPKVSETVPITLGTGTTGDWASVQGGSLVLELLDQHACKFIHHPSGGYLFIMFYINECRYSSRSKKEFALAAEKVVKESSLKFASVNCKVNKETCISEKIKGYPTFNLYWDGKFIEEYKGVRSKDKFQQYCLKPPTPSSFWKWLQF